MTENRMLSPIELEPLPRTPLVSVVVSCYNYDRFLRQALSGLVAQSYSRFEGIVCDDGSTDRSAAIVQEYSESDPRIQLLSQENSGQAAALNAAFRRSRGDVICLLDADDTFHPNKLELVTSYLRRTGRGAVLHPMTLIDERGTTQGEIPVLSHFEQGWIAERVITRGGRWRSMQTSALSFRREVAQRIFPIPSQFRSYADAFVVMLLPLLTTVGAVDTALASYRMHEQSVTRTELPGTKESVRTNAEIWAQTVEAANVRLATLGTNVSLDVSRNLEYRQRRFVLDVVSGELSRLKLAARLWNLARLIARDDLYNASQKALRLMQFALSVVIHPARREAWLQRGFTVPKSVTSLKERLRR